VTGFFGNNDYLAVLKGLIQRRFGKRLKSRSVEASVAARSPGARDASAL